MSVIGAAAAIISAYLVLLNFFGGVFGAGGNPGWGNPLLWLISALSALIVVILAAWLLTRTMRWMMSRPTDH